MENIYFNRNEIWAIESKTNSGEMSYGELRVWMDILRKMNMINEKSK